MPLHHVTHCKGCSEEVALRIVQMLVDAGAEPGLARDKNGAAASVENKLALRPASSPVAAFSGRSCLRLPTALKLRPASASLGQPAAWAALPGRIGRVSDTDHCDQGGDSTRVDVRREAAASEASHTVSSSQTVTRPRL